MSAAFILFISGGPLLVGVIQPKLYVPQTMEEESLQMALRYELAHLRKGDLWLKLLVQLDFLP